MLSFDCCVSFLFSFFLVHSDFFNWTSYRSLFIYFVLTEKISVKYCDNAVNLKINVTSTEVCSVQHHYYIYRRLEIFWYIDVCQKPDIHIKYINIYILYRFWIAIHFSPDYLKTHLLYLSLSCCFFGFLHSQRGK